ncbi:DUF4430 domain-containing protein [Clostridium sp. D2Q-11]|uniref:DUF4430 domain-containing protein n=1 Tax=Anaeromonas frigoriresistens TaxID=2683708 RepID=A0A942V0P8_9FIRM|nr:DUF4430 domain-containing protein [Anaeromonas frigoriresistens]MBS4539037.1 DUF4430 domain-containing protein [Anaeromonas frigoriresistens]
MNKKILIIILAVVLAGGLFVAYDTILAPKGVEGEKEVIIEVVVDKEDINETFTLNTDQEFLLGLLEEKQEKLGASFTEYDFGTMVTGMKGYEAQESEQEYFHVTVNGEDAQTGPKEIPVKDGDTYKFELKTY